MTSKLYTLTAIDAKTGKRVVIYGHVTANVISQYWEAYTDNPTTARIEIKPYVKDAD